MNSDKLLWYVNRLRSMRKREILHRLGEAVELRRPATSRTGNIIPSLNVHDDSVHSRLLDVWPTLFTDTSSAYCQSQASEAISGSTSVFGHSWSTRSKQWNADPVTGYFWPFLPAHQIDYRHSAGADPKWIWEINRLLFLLPVAFAVAAGEVERSAGEEMIKETISDWIAKSRPGYGPQWAASIEVAIRAIAMTISIQAVKNADIAFHNRVAKSVGEHASWIRRFPSLYSSANNHRVAEIAALLILSSSWEGVLTQPEVSQLERELCEVSRALFSEDGIGLEQSPTYAGFSVEFLALVLHSHRWSDEHNRKVVEQIVYSAAYALSQFTNEDGSLIRYGDDDEGKIVTVAVPDDEYSAALVRLATGVHQPRQQGVSTFTQGGISLMRFFDASAETTWVFDHGPLGFGDIAAHGHADTLAVSMRSGGVDWIIDAGTYKYHGDKKWRTYFRSSRAHNAPQVDSRDSSVMTGDFNWDPQKRAQGELLFSHVDGQLFCLRASHDGYMRQGLGSVSRAVERRGEGTYRITDSYDGEEMMSTGFLINPECQVLSLQSGWRIVHPQSRQEVQISVSGHSALSTENPEDETAWFSPAFGKKVPTWRLLSSTAGSVPGRQLVFDFVFSTQYHQEA